jgi:hypothetical protein
MATKRKVTVTIDEDLAEALERAGSVSGQLNQAGWDLVERRSRLERLRSLLDALDAEDGPLSDDPAEEDRLRRLLGGAA